MDEYTLAWCETCNGFKPARCRDLDYGERRFVCRDCVRRNHGA